MWATGDRERGVVAGGERLFWRAAGWERWRRRGFRDGGGEGRDHDGRVCLTPAAGDAGGGDGSRFLARVLGRFTVVEVIAAGLMLVGVDGIFAGGMCRCVQSAWVLLVLWTVPGGGVAGFDAGIFA